jgi:hypothetical protein
VKGGEDEKGLNSKLKLRGVKCNENGLSQAFPISIS